MPSEVIMRCVIGIDFGTLSARAILVDVAGGVILGESVFRYPHGVIDRQMLDGEKLPPAWALQHPEDYLAALENTVKGVLHLTGVDPGVVIGISVDFTCCTLIPVDDRLTPLCLLQEFEHNKHAYPKLWKHHAAQKYADQLSRIARQREEAFLNRYCGYISPEWAIPKMMELYDQATEVCRSAAWYMEAGDWITFLMTGNLIHSSSYATYKSAWSVEENYPSDDFFEALSPGFSKEVKKHTGLQVQMIGTKAGELTERYADILGLKPGTAVGVPSGDAYAAVLGESVVEEGELIIVIGTSSCDAVFTKEKRRIYGIDCVLKDAIIPGLYAYEAGQFGTGDTLDWAVNYLAPYEYYNEAKEKGLSLHQLLSAKAEVLKPGESGLLALDWFNGNRSVLRNASLSGAVIGLNMTTKPEEIYRSLIEATAFGQQTIINAFVDAGIKINRIILSGGVARKNRFLDQVYADVFGRDVVVSNNPQASALGSAMYAAVAAGPERGGCRDVFEAAEKMRCKDRVMVTPNENNHLTYRKLYEYYRTIHDYFGVEDDLMRKLRALKAGQ